MGESFAKHLGIRVFHAKILNLKLHLMNQVIQEHCGNDCLEPRLGCCQLEMDGWISTRPLVHPSRHHSLLPPKRDPVSVASYHLLKGDKESEIFLTMASLSKMFLY